MAHRHAGSRTCLLRAGERRVVHAVVGSRWLLARGEAELIEAPRWLGERIVQVVQTLRGDATYRVEQGGWVTLHARVDTVVVCLEPAAAASWLRAAWRIIRSTRRALAPAC
jgi:hypothetical protein